MILSGRSPKTNKTRWKTRKIIIDHWDIFACNMPGAYRTYKMISGTKQYIRNGIGLAIWKANPSSIKVHNKLFVRPMTRQGKYIRQEHTPHTTTISGTDVLQFQIDIFSQKKNISYLWYICFVSMCTAWSGELLWSDSMLAIIIARVSYGFTTKMKWKDENQRLSSTLDGRKILHFISTEGVRTSMGKSSFVFFMSRAQNEILFIGSF